jgi:Flp pilus assembly pilin Flp
MIKSFGRDESGATSIEYGFIGAVVSIAVFAGAELIGLRVLTQYLQPLASALR